MGNLLDPVNLMVRMPIVLLALTVHEFSHAYVAWRMGDPTAMRQGRCSLNPLRHLDVLGTICLLFAPIGWAKPVPVDARNFRDPRKGDLYTSAAGPLSNLAQAVIFGLLLRLMTRYAGHWELLFSGPPMLKAMALMCIYGVGINVGLAAFNCLPIFPLDGFHITLQLVSSHAQRRMLEMAQYGPYMILGLVLLGSYGKIDLLGRIIDPPTDFILKYVGGLGA